MIFLQPKIMFLSLSSGETVQDSISYPVKTLFLSKDHPIKHRITHRIRNAVPLLLKMFLSIEQDILYDVGII